VGLLREKDLRLGEGREPPTNIGQGFLHLVVPPPDIADTHLIYDFPTSTCIGGIGLEIC